MNFAKMHGLGNDFIVIENLDCSLKKLEDLAVKLCNRHTGIGGDGILVVETSQSADIKMRIINSDGSNAEMCGNGLRCFAKYIYEKGIINKDIITVETLAGIMTAEIRNDNQDMKIKVNMGIPCFEKESIPFRGNENNLDYSITTGNQIYRATTLQVGVPHTIVYVENIDNNEIIEYGKKIEKLSYFPKGTNVNFVKVINRKCIQLKTWERGAGLTLACGTGTCASVVGAYKNNLVDSEVTAILELGELNICYDGTNVYMEGPATLVFEGEI